MLPVCILACCSHDTCAQYPPYPPYPPNTHATFTQTNIRVVGGLLSAHDVSGDPVFLDKAEQLADRLLQAFNSTTGMYAGDMYPHKCQRGGGRVRTGGRCVPCVHTYGCVCLVCTHTVVCALCVHTSMCVHLSMCGFCLYTLTPKT